MAGRRPKNRIEGLSCTALSFVARRVTVTRSRHGPLSRSEWPLLFFRRELGGNPPFTAEAFLGLLARQGLPQTVVILQEHIALI